MTWQEYQDAVGELYNNMEKIGHVKKNILIPDKITGQNRQVDVWLEALLGDCKIKILVDAKLRSVPIDVKDVEEVAMLADAVKANKAIIVTNNGWTKPALKKAEFLSMDIRILSIENALNLIIVNKWFMCDDCHDECVVLDWDGVIFRETKNIFFDWQAGRCRKCDNLYIHCPCCGSKVILQDSDAWTCSCGNKWKKTDNKLFIKFKSDRKFIRIDDSYKAPPELILWLLRYPEKYWKGEIGGQLFTVTTDKGRLYSFNV